MSGVIYVLVNQAMPGLIKIGRTAENIEMRMRQLDTSGVPLPFECFYAAEVADPAKVERALHEAFEDQRVRKNREFFELSPDKPKVIIKLMELRDVTPRTDIVSEPGDQEALNQARRRRSRFRFSAVGIKPGSVLHSAFDDAVTCTLRTTLACCSGARNTVYPALQLSSLERMDMTGPLSLGRCIGSMKDVP